MTILGRRLIVAMAALACGASAQAKLMEDAVANVNGAPILLSEYQKELRGALELWGRSQPGAMASPELLRGLREKTLEQLIDHELLYQEGARLKLKVRERDIESAVEEVKVRFSRDDQGKPLSPAEIDEMFKKQLKNDGFSFSQFRDRISRQVMMRKTIESEVKPKVRNPDEKEAREYFDRIRAFIVSGSTLPPRELDEESGMIFMEVAKDVRLLSSERVRVSRILVRFSPGASPQEKKRAHQAALDVKKRLDEGKASFAEIARSESEDPEGAAQGGDIGFVFRGVAPPDFEKAAFAMPVGEISAPIETEIGYHVIRVMEKRAAETPDFERFREQLSEFLRNVNFNKEVGSYVKGLKAKAVIERNIPQ